MPPARGPSVFPDCADGLEPGPAEFRIQSKGKTAAGRGRPAGPVGMSRGQQGRRRPRSLGVGLGIEGCPGDFPGSLESMCSTGKDQ